MNLRARYSLALARLGYVPTPTRSRRYLAFTRRFGGDYVWLGRSGAVRWASSGVIADSVPVSDATRRRLLAIADGAPVTVTTEDLSGPVQCPAVCPHRRAADYDARHGVRADGYPPSDADPETGVQYGEVA